MNFHTKETSYNNRYFSEKYYYSGKSNIPTSMRIVWYNQEMIDSELIDPGTPCFSFFLREDCINWIKVQGLRDAENITRMVLEFGMTSLDVRDILTPGHVVKIDNHNNKVLIIINSCSFEHDDHLFTEYIAIFVKGNLLITFAETDEPLFENVENALLGNVMNVRQQSSGILLGFILNSLLVDLIESASRMERMLEKIEDTLLSNNYSQKSLGHKIQKCRHVCLIIRKNSHPLRSEFGTLLTPIEAVTRQEDIYMFEELSDQLEFIIQTTYNSESMLNSLVDLYAPNNDMRANVIMERLTIVATLFIPITFLVGVWGMNFDYTPELHTKYGYLLAWAVILFTAAFTWGYMKRKKWF